MTQPVTRAAPATRTWTVDTIAPPNPTIDSAPADLTNSAAASFSFSDSESNVSFFCKLDAGALSACTSAMSYTGLTDGGHTFLLRARDAAGNESGAVTRTWTVDTVEPAVTLTAPVNGSATANTTPMFSGAAGAGATDSTTVTVEVYIGGTPTGTPVQTLSTTRTGGTWSVFASPALADGTYTAQAEQGDAAGNSGLSSASTFTIDTTAPTVTLTAPANGNSTDNPRPTFSGTAGTAPRDLSAVTVKIYTGGAPIGTPVQTLTTTAQAGGAYSVTATSALQTGTYTARSEQGDSVANTGLSSANTFTVTSQVLIAAGDISDCGSPGDEATAALLDQFPSASVQTLGDNVYPTGTSAQYSTCYNPSWGRAKTRTHPALADHDYGDVQGGDSSGYFSYFQAQLAPHGPSATDPNKGYYSYDLGAWHVVVVNASCFYYAPACDSALQAQWLRSDLAAHPTDCTLAVVHQPRFSSGNVHGSNTSVYIQSYWNALYDYGAEIVLSGDDHIYERFGPQNPNGVADPSNGIREFIVGTGGASHYGIGTIQPNSQVRNTGTFGVLKLTLNPSSYDWEFIPEAGRTFTDSGTTSCHAAPPPPPAGTPAVRAVSSNTSNGPATSITFTKPAGAVTGDLLLAIAANMNGSGRSMAAPAGWTTIPNTDQFNGTAARTHAWYKVAGATEPPDYTFALTGGSGYDMSGGILAIVGANATIPINASGGQNSGATLSTSVIAPSITTSVANTLLAFGGACNVQVAFAPPPGMTEQWDRASSGSFRVVTETATQAFAGTGATGTRTATLSGACKNDGILIAVAP